MPISRAITETELLVKFGNKLRSLRLERNLSQEVIAAESGLSRSYYTEIETGKRNISLINMRKLADCL